MTKQCICGKTQVEYKPCPGAKCPDCVHKSEYCSSCGSFTHPAHKK